MLLSIELKNFKCFQDSGRVSFRPLTLLVGPNSSGKSSILQAILLLKQTVESRDPQNPMLVKGQYVDLGSFSDFVYGHEVSRTVSFQVSLTERQRRAAGIPAPAELKVEATFGFDDGTKRIELLEYQISVPSREHYLHVYERTDGDWHVDFQGPWSWRGGRKARVKNQRLSLVPTKFYGFDLTKEDFQRLKPSQQDAFRSVKFLSLDFEASFRQLFYLGPLRDSPKRFYLAAGETPFDVGLRGERATEVLQLTQAKAADLTILRAVKEWFERFGFAKDVQVEMIGESHYYLRVTDPNTGVDVNAADIGFGASQILPVLIEGFYAPVGSMILIEQPEIHLHPRVQAQLADLMVEVSKNSKTILLETHSEYLINRVRRRIADGTIPREQVALYFCVLGPQGSVVKEIEINDLGQIERWPGGFFEEDLFESAEYDRAVAEKLRGR